jgi:phage recombination protein Bet
MTTTGDVREAAAQRARERALAVPEDDQGPGDKLAIRTGQSDWSPEQLAALEAMGVTSEAGPAELAVFLHVCRVTALNPFRKQIYLIPRWDNQARKRKWVTQTSIDGFRLIRDRAGRRDGWTASYEDPVWLDDKGREHRYWLQGANVAPWGAKFVALKVAPDGTVLGRYPKIVRYEAYVDLDKNDEPRNRWKIDPDGMIMKCAEAGALRSMCPEDLGGLYIAEELEREDRPGAGRRARQHPPVTATVVTPGGDPQPGEHVVEGVVRPQGNAADADMEEQRKTSLAAIHAIFGEHGLSGPGEAAEVRHLVAGNLAREEGEPVVAVTDLGQLDAVQAIKVAERLRQFTSVKNRDVPKALHRMADSARRELGK